MVAIYCDTADLAAMSKYAPDLNVSGVTVSGFTTNPSWLKKSGITNYRKFADAALKIASGKPVSFEVFADDFGEMERQAREIAGWGKVHVKIPITNCSGESSHPVIISLKRSRIDLNVTAVFTLEQVARVRIYLTDNDILSVFAGRIADTGRDPEQTMIFARSVVSAKLLWASAREPFNVAQADRCGCDIITLTPDLIDKLAMFGRDLSEYSLETVRQFKRDSEGLTL